MKKKLLRFGMIGLAFLLTLSPLTFSIAEAYEEEYAIPVETVSETRAAMAQHRMDWSFTGYAAPDFRAEVRGIFHPQTVSIMEQRQDGWALVRMSSGNVWIFLRDNVRHLPQSAMITPQSVRLLAEEAYLIEIPDGQGRTVDMSESAPPSTPTRHAMEWQFVTYLEPNLLSTPMEVHDPQVVSVLERRDDGWALISTGYGNRWVFVRDNLRYISRNFTIHETKGGPAMVRSEPQVVRILAQDGDWLQISTWQGPRWINPGNRASVPGERRVALTFDDGPHPVHTARLLDALAARDVSVTFYVLGQQVAAQPQLANRIVREGHEIANHSFSHRQLTRLNAAGIRSELARTQDVIRQVTGATTTTFRPPYGSQNQTVRNVAAEFGYPLILWSVDTLDWQSRNVNSIMSHFVDARGNIRIRDGDIILMHDIHPATIDAAIRAVDLLLANGFTFVTVAELLGSPTPGVAYIRG